MRTLDSINNHPDQWVVEWFDEDGYLVQAIGVNDPFHAALYAKRAVTDTVALIKEAGLSAHSVRLRKVAGEPEYDGDV